MMYRSISCLAARGKSRAALRADLVRQLCVAKSAIYSSMTVVSRLDLTKNLSLSHAADFHHGLPVARHFDTASLSLRLIGMSRTSAAGNDGSWIKIR